MTNQLVFAGKSTYIDVRSAKSHRDVKRYHALTYIYLYILNESSTNFCLLPKARDNRNKTKRI